MHILILAAAEPPSSPLDSNYPIWLSEVDGSLLIEKQVRDLGTVQDARFIFMFRQSDVDAYFLHDIVRQIVPGGVVLGVREATAGAACTALLATEAIDMDDELIVANATDHINTDYDAVIRHFRTIGADAGILTFNSLHPSYSYVRTNDDGWVTESAEKRPISRRANAGFYWFAKAADFFNSIRDMILKDAHIQGRFYICPALNQLILQQKKIATLQIEQDQYCPLKSQRDVNALEYLGV
jgi:hypothetical protein